MTKTASLAPSLQAYSELLPYSESRPSAESPPSQVAPLRRRVRDMRPDQSSVHELTTQVDALPPSTTVRVSPIVDGMIRGINPWTGSSLPEVAVSTAEQVKNAVKHARRAQASWKAFTLKERSTLLKKAAKRLLAERARGLTLVSQELGKVPADALFTEALGPLDALNGWLRVIESAPGGEVKLNPIAFPNKKARVELVPHGVIGIIAPWNFPIAGLYRSVFPALLLGNSIVVKPSEYSPRSSAWFLEVLAQELPFGVVQVIQGDGAVGEELLNADINACVFTGSSAVGTYVERVCFERSIPCSAEMGGNDAAIVLGDADLGRTVAAITHWSLQNAGQACGAIKIVYVEQAIAAEFTLRLTRAWRRLHREHTLHPSGSLAPVAFDAQKTLVLGRISQATELGAQVLVGGDAQGLSVEPTLLSSCTEDMDVVSEETFGPVLPIVVVEDAYDAISRVNRSKYGLTASIWTKQMERAERLASQLDVGVVTVNNHAVTGAIVDLPWSGRRSSGHGVANSAWSLQAFVHPKAILLDRSTSAEPYWMPYDETLEDLGASLADVQLGYFKQALQVPRLLAQRLRSVNAFFEIGSK